MNEIMKKSTVYVSFVLLIVLCAVALLSFGGCKDGNDDVNDEEKELEFSLLDSGSYSVSVGNMQDEEYIEIPSSKNGRFVTEIAHDGFKGAKLKKISIPSTIKKIGGNAFAECEFLESIELPSSLESVGYSAFSKCRSLSSMTLYNTHVKHEGVIRTEMKYMFGSSANDIPRSLKNITFNGEKIDDNAFIHCSTVINFTFGEKLTEIGAGAFSYCYGIKEINIPDNVKELGAEAFLSCRDLVSVSVGKGISTLKVKTFYSCPALQNVNLSEGLLTIEDMAFSECNALQSMDIPDTVSKLGAAIFQNCKALESIVLPSETRMLGQYMFFGCTSLENMTLGEKTSNIPKCAFYGCLSLKSIDLPYAVQNIGDNAFGNCMTLENITCDRTKSLWKKVKKDTNWDEGTPNYTIHCTDGDIVKGS